MARTGPFHHIGTFLLFAAFVFLLVVSISSPTVNHLSLVRVSLTNGSHVTFGSFGACITNPGPDYCTGHHVGYNPAAIMNRIDGTQFSHGADTAKALTRVNILHPIACGLAFLAFLSALGAGICGALLAALIALPTCLITLVALGCDFGWAAIIKHHVNDGNDDHSGSKAHYRECIWLVLAAAIALLIGTMVVLLTCCSKRMQDRRDRRAGVGKNEGYVAGTGGKRKFWQRTRY